MTEDIKQTVNLGAFLPSHAEGERAKVLSSVLSGDVTGIGSY